MNTLREDISKAASDGELRAAVAELYKEVEEQVGQLEVTCGQCGKCCHFEEFGQELLASTAELGYLWSWLKKHPLKLISLVGRTGESSPKVCPFLKAQSCTVREARALGCRVFFCQAEGVDKERMENIYETYHKRIAELHKQRDVSYHYLTWDKVMSMISSFLSDS